MGKMAASLCVILIVCLVACGAEPEAIEDTSPADVADTAELSTSTSIPPTDSPEPPTHTPASPTLNAMEIAMTQQVSAPDSASANALDTDEISITKDILYAMAIDPEAQDQYLDIYAPGSPGEYSVVLWAHGLEGDKNGARSLGRILAKEGIVTVGVSFGSYDLLNKYQDTKQEIAVLREVLEEAKCALQFIGNQIEDYGGDPTRVIWAGYSYGAWLGSLITLGQGDLQSLWDEYASVNGGPSQQIICAEQVQPAEVVAFIGSGTPVFSDFWFGTETNDDPTALVPELREYAAIGHGTETKVRLIYGEDDVHGSMVIEGSQSFAVALEEAGYDVAIYPQDGSHEPFWEKIIEQVLILTMEESNK